ncbi:MAG: GAF domain-containing protein, partial [Anaerolineae bacterium]|nr:GAF domain-containing protein [Anaerolineae bacterium]
MFRTRRWDYLLEISQALTAQLDLDTVLLKVLQAAAALLSGQAGLIALRDAGGGGFAIRAVYGLPLPLKGYFSALLSDIPEKASRTDFLIPGLADKLNQVALETGLPLRQVVALPMAIGPDLIGVLYVFRIHGSSFTAEERAILNSFADQAAIAVHNAQLYQGLANEKRRLDAVLEYSADGVMVLLPSQRVVIFNRALTELTGWPAAETVGRHHDEVIQWRRLETEMDLARAIVGGWPLAAGRRGTSPLYVEGDLRQRGGGHVSVGITYAPLLDRDGRLVNIIANVRDISRFREADRLKNTFVSVVSHELKTPVTIIQGYAETLNRPDAHWDRETLQQGLQTIDSEAQKLCRLIDDLLDVSRLRAGGIPLKMEPVDLRAVAEDVVRRFQPQTARHTLSVHFRPDTPPVYGDPGRLEQVLTNLVSNAIKYSPGGGRVRIQGRVRLDELVVTVSDEGVGIPLTEQARIFEPFYRVESPLSRTVEGTGLGLSLVKAIV